MQYWNNVVSIRNNVARLCWAKNCRCESSPVTSPLGTCVEFTAITKINGSTMDVELQVLSRFFGFSAVGGGGGYIRCIMGNVKMVNLKISRS